jgi:hypothetical protein
MREMSGSSEPVRLREGSASALERALLDAGRSYRSTGNARAKTLAALGVAGSATLLAGTAQAVPLATVAKMTWGKLIAAISIVGAAAAVPVGYFSWQRHHQPARHGGAASPAVVAAKPIEAQPAQVPPAVLPTVTARALEQQRTEQVADNGAAGVAHAARPAVTLAHELSSLDAARGLLARGDANGALARLDAYARTYPHGRLGLEAEVLRIDALDESGRGEAARARAEAPLQRQPHSVLATRVRTRLGD